MTMKVNTDPLEIVNEETIFTLHEICEHCGVRVDYVVELVEYGVITPLREVDPRQWAFDALSLARLKRALRLQRDMEINLPGVAVSLDLLDEVQRLRQQIDLLDGQLKQLLGE